MGFEPANILCSAARESGGKLWCRDLREAKCDVTLVGHLGWVSALTFAPDGSLCTGSKDTTVRVWDKDLRSMQCIATLTGHEGWVSSLAFAHDGALCSGSEDKTVRVWDKHLRSGRCTAILVGHEDSVLTLAFAPDGTLCSGSKDQTIRVWDWQPRIPTCIATISGHSGWVSTLAFAPDGTLCSGSADCTVKVWDRDFRAQRCICTLAGHTGWVSTLAFDPAGVLCSGSYDCTVKLWDLRSGRPTCVTTLSEHTGWVLTLAFAPDGTLCSGSKDRTVKIWDWTRTPQGPSATCVATLAGHAGWVSALVFAPDGALVSASDDRTVKVWCGNRVIDAAWLWDYTVQDVSSRGISLRQMLNFFKTHVSAKGLPLSATTADVILQVVVPLTRDRRCSLAEWLENDLNTSGPRSPSHYVVHAWNSCFADSLRSLVGAASMQRSCNTDVRQLEAEVKSQGGDTRFLDEYYWFCGFCVNQHTSDDRVAERPVRSDDPRCETDKFEAVQSWIKEGGGDVVVLLDAEFRALRRLWCQDEIYEGARQGMPLRVAQFPVSPLQDGHLSDLRTCEATHEVDRARILRKVSGPGGVGFEEFDRRVRAAVHRGHEACVRDDPCVQNF